ncbi:hypothetical protein CRM22_008466 [Opisthorchis felineus]|uniref:Uncharacterized protein n=1 Tax=Opisthorchis felineus TaxID=147828 RepID=A0A4S2LAX1_OPIFE|nr:hypothetical protein CRM22_008466 [Opisthorchis felineus]
MPMRSRSVSSTTSWLRVTLSTKGFKVNLVTRFQVALSEEKKAGAPEEGKDKDSRAKDTLAKAATLTQAKVESEGLFEKERQPLKHLYPLKDKTGITIHPNKGVKGC